MIRFNRRRDRQQGRPPNSCEDRSFSPRVIARAAMSRGSLRLCRRSASAGSHLKANSIVNWFVALFWELGYAGCSSHSGRRSFITMAARNIHRSGCSLRDVQLLAGHRSIETTERYIDGDTCAQRRLVAYV
jgi:integrase